MSGLPTSWALAALAELCTINPAAARDFGDDVLCSFVPMAAVEEETGRLDPSQVRSVGDLRSRSYRSFREGDVLVAKITPSMENGKAAVARGLVGRIGFGSTEFHVLRPEGGIDADYLLRFLLQPSFRVRARQHMTGTAGQLRVPAGYLSSAIVPLPPGNEQRRISAAIDEWFSRLDGAEADVRSAVLRLRTLGLSLLIAIDRVAAPLKPLAAIASLITDGDHKPPARVSEGVPHLTAKNVKKGRLTVEGCSYVSDAGFEQTRRRYDPLPGDVIVTCVGTIGQTAIVEDGFTFSADRNLAAIRPLSEVDSRYLRYALMTPSIQRAMAAASGSTAQPHLYLRDLRGLEIRVPSLDEQRRIVGDIERQLSLVESLRVAAHFAQKRSAALRRSILERSFRGELVPQDPDDEPASMLLERIRAERAAAPKPTRMKRARA